MSAASAAMTSMGEAGYLVRRGLVAPPLLRSINTLMRARAARVMAALGDRPIGLGSVNGYSIAAFPLEHCSRLHGKNIFAFDCCPTLLSLGKVRRACAALAQPLGRTDVRGRSR